MPAERNVTALVLAGERRGAADVARVAGVPCKALAALAGTPMVVRVLNALQATGRVRRVILCGPDPAAIKSCPQLQAFIDQDAVTWVPAADSLGASVQAGLARVEPDALALITTADHALLDAGIIDCFLDQVLDGQAGVSVGVVDYALLRAKYPGARRTVLRFAEGGYCGCNLYALAGARARDVVSLWQRAQAHRKRPWRMALGLFGVGTLARYVCGRLGMGQASQAILEATGLAVAFIRLPFAHAGIDVDTVADLELARRILSRRN